MTNTAASFSRSEDAGIDLMPANAQNIYSVGISTAGEAEMRMAEQLPEAHIIATTIDEQGAEFAHHRIDEAGLGDRVEVKLEDVAEPLPYKEQSFDYMYARLILHYLTKDQLAATLPELYRVLKAGGKLFVVVRSTDCECVTAPDAMYDSETHLTSYSQTLGGVERRQARYFHTEQSITDAIKEAGFTVDSVESYDEQIFKDFMRTEVSERSNNLIQVLATR